MRNIILLLSLFFLSACGHNPKGENRKGKCVKNIDLDNLSSPSFNDYFSKLEIIPIDSSREALIQKVSEQVWYRGKLYVLDNNQKKVFIFDQKNGKLIHTIDKRGNGPGEYTDITDLQINRFTGDLELLNPMGGILKYDSLGSVYKGHINLPPTLGAAHNFISISPDIYLYFCAARDGNKMVMYNMKQDKIVSELYNKPTFVFFSTFYHHSYSPFYLFEDKVHFVQSYNGDVFTFEDYKLSNKFQWNFGKYNFDIADLEKNRDIPYYMEHYKTIGSQHATIFISYAENSQYYMTQFNFHKKICSLIYNKKNNNYTVFNSFKEGHRLIPSFIDESAVYLFAESRTLPIVVNRDELSEENQRIYDSIDSESNPVILKYTLK